MKRKKKMSIEELDKNNRRRTFGLFWIMLGFFSMIGYLLTPIEESGTIAAKVLLFMGIVFFSIGFWKIVEDKNGKRKRRN